MSVPLTDIAPAWRAFQGALPVRICPPRSDEHYAQLVDLMNALLDQVGDDESHPDFDLLDLVGHLISAYEHERIVIADATPVSVLRHLMEQHGLSQADLKDQLGSQSVASEILNGHRSINVRQAKALAQRFNVSPGVFV